MILNQGQTGQCKDYGFATALFIENPSIDKQAVLSAINENQEGLLTNRKAGEFFKSRGFIKDIEQVPRLKAKGLLTKGIPLICNLNGVDWDATGRPPFIAQFIEGKIASHNGTAIGFDPITRLIKVQNTWGEGWGDGGCYYLRAQDISKASEFCRLII